MGEEIAASTRHRRLPLRLTRTLSRTHKPQPHNNINAIFPRLTLPPFPSATPPRPSLSPRQFDTCSKVPA